MTGRAPGAGLNDARMGSHDACVGSHDAWVYDAHKARGRLGALAGGESARASFHPQTNWRLACPQPRSPSPLLGWIRCQRGHMTESSSTAARRAIRRQVVRRVASDQAGVVSRSQVYASGMGRAEVRAELVGGRWQRVGRHVLALNTGRLELAATLWAAALSGGPRAMLDGEAALLAAGLEGYRVSRLRVSVPRGARTFRDGVFDVRQTRRWSADDLVGAGVPRTRPGVAAVRAGLWAVSNRQAALVLTCAVQQRLTTADEVAAELSRIRRAPRLGFVSSVVADLLGGVRSLPERDFAEECRRRGLPEPTRQAVRRGRSGRYYLDALWEEWGVAVEIDGVQHNLADQVVPDALRHNELTLQRHTVLRLPALGLRVAPDEFFEQIVEALIAGGWRGGAAA